MNRTDMAREARALHRDIDGVSEQTEETGGVTVSRIGIESQKASILLDKPTGRYITIEAPKLEYRDTEQMQTVRKVFARELAQLLEDNRVGKSVLVAGLGNRYVTPDALGPRTAEKVFVTRHIQGMPEFSELAACRCVAAVSPGVLGATGVETTEMIRGIVSAVQPDALLCIDALASIRATRISTAIQMNDTGISPGAGIGNFRQSINKEILGIPVIAVGVPMVVSAATILQDAMQEVAKISGETDNADTLVKLVHSTMPQEFLNMIVTPKDVDQVLSDMSSILAEGINRALFDESYSDIREWMQ